jgi:hypothetical protein
MPRERWAISSVPARPSAYPSRRSWASNCLFNLPQRKVGRNSHVHKTTLALAPRRSGDICFGVVFLWVAPVSLGVVCCAAVGSRFVYGGVLEKCQVGIAQLQFSSYPDRSARFACCIACLVETGRYSLRVDLAGTHRNGPCARLRIKISHLLQRHSPATRLTRSATGFLLSSTIERVHKGNEGPCLRT